MPVAAIPRIQREVKATYVCKNCQQKQDSNLECVKCHGLEFSVQYVNYMPGGEKHKYRVLKNVAFRGATVRAGSVLEICADELKYVTPGLFERVSDNAKEVMADAPRVVVREVVEMKDGSEVEVDVARNGGVVAELK